MKMLITTKKFFFSIILLSSFILVNGQNNNVQLTLQQAHDLALQQNKSIQAASMDKIIAQKTKWETITNYFPKASASAKLLDNLKLQTVLLPAVMIGGAPGEYIPVQFGMEFQTSWSIEVQQLIFSLPLIIGIQLSNLGAEMAELGYLNTEREVVSSVNSVYTSALVLKHNLNILDSNIVNLQNVRQQTQAMYEVGVLQSTDVDQIDLTIMNIENTKKALERSLELSYNVLRFQLGLDTNVVFELTTDINDILNEGEINNLILTPVDIYKNIDYQFVEKQRDMALLSLRKEKSDFAPTIAGFYTYSEAGQGNKLNDLRWFPASIAGLTISLPLINGGQNGVQVSKAKVELQKSNLTLDMVNEQLKIQEKQLKYNLSNAYENYLTQKKNIEVSNRVYKNIEMRYLQGVASSLELTQANTNYLTAQSNYLSNNTRDSVLFVEMSGIYSVTATNFNEAQTLGCFGSDTIKVTFIPNAYVDLGPDLCLLEGPVTLDATYAPGFSYLWSTGANTPIIHLNEPGIYDISVVVFYEDPSMCAGHDTVKIKLIPTPIIELPDTMFMCAHQARIISVEQMYDYLYNFEWSTGNTTPTQIFQNMLPGIYDIQVKVIGCDTTIHETRLTVDDCAIMIPNVITPNGDGINDYFQITNIDYYPNSEIKIYNRWGKRVYESQNYQGDWDGEGLDEGTYYYIFRLNYGNGQISEYHGTITILRN
jgi:outer membrane protein